MRCLITLETRPCEDPINFKVLLLPIKLTIIKNIRLFALPTYKGLTVGTPEQGRELGLTQWRTFKNLPVPLLPPVPHLPEAKPFSEDTVPRGPGSTQHTTAPSLLSLLTATMLLRHREGRAVPKTPQVFWRKCPRSLELRSSHVRRELYANPLASFQNAKSPENTASFSRSHQKHTTAVFHLWNHTRKQWSYSPQAPRRGKTSSQDRNPFLWPPAWDPVAPSPTQGAVPPLQQNQGCSLPKHPAAPSNADSCDFHHSRLLLLKWPELSLYKKYQWKAPDLTHSLE